MGLTDTPSEPAAHQDFRKAEQRQVVMTNASPGREAALVSDMWQGTTTDPVYKAMEVHGIGPCVFIDTAGCDDEGSSWAVCAWSARREAARKTDVALLLFSDGGLKQELGGLPCSGKRKTPVVAVVNKADEPNAAALAERVREEAKLEPVLVSARTGKGGSAARGHHSGDAVRF